MWRELEVCPASTSERGTVLLSPRQSLNRDLPAKSYVHLQFVTTEKRHTNQWIGICFVNENTTLLSIPNDLGNVHVEQALAAVRENAATDAFSS